MSTSDILNYLQNTPVAYAISKTNHVVGAGLQVVHIFGFLALLTALVLINLRVFGLAFAQRPFAQIARTPLRWIRWGLVLAIISGIWMFIASAVLYAGKTIFSIKIIFFLIAAVAHLLVFRNVVKADAPITGLTRAVAAFTLILWLLVAAAGRGIGFF